MASIYRRPGKEYFSHNSSTYTRVFVWLFVTFHFIVQVNREAFNLSIWIIVTVIYQSLTVLLENFDISIFSKYSIVS